MKNLFKEKSEYSADFDAHLLEQYKMYAEMADRISGRRQSTNTFYLTIHVATITLIKNVDLDTGAGNSQLLFYIVASIVGILLSLAWYKFLRLYKKHNSVKYTLLQEFEKKLPAAPYTKEWECLEESKSCKPYCLFTKSEKNKSSKSNPSFIKIEQYVPWVFVFLYGFVIFSMLCHPTW